MKLDGKENLERQLRLIGTYENIADGIMACIQSVNK